MSHPRSFEQLNYSIRPNKCVERKLIARVVSLVGSTGAFDISTYQYIGFGSIWFSDFALFHRVLRIEDMTSIEKESSRYQRLRFNKPYDLITVIDGKKYSETIPELNWTKRALVWLDYDGILNSEVFDDLKRTILQVQSGSVLFVSVNADAWQLKNVKVDQRELTEPEALRISVPNPELPPDYETRLGRAQFPNLVGDILGNAFSNFVSDRTGAQFIKLMNLTYADNAPMVTFGGLIVDAPQMEAASQIPLESLSFLAGPPQFQLAVPNLSTKEKIAFDQLLPREQLPSSQELGFELRDKEIEAYVRFYLEYPVFGEFQI